jgi:hypothetical protein
MSRVQVPIPREELYAGVVGDVVRTFSPCTEASPVAIAMQFLVAMGNAVGLPPHLYVGETRHGLNENLLIVGRSSFARKGDASNSALRILKVAAPDWAKNIASGLSSGEGLIYAVRDPISTTDKKTGKLVVTDAGVIDKRLLVIESEFSEPLKMFKREGNILSDVIRQAWDGNPLRTLTKGSPARATGAHISVIGHTTPEDLRAHLTDLDIANGLGNRFLFALVERAQLLPNPSRVPDTQLQPLVDIVADVLRHGSSTLEMQLTHEAAALWVKVYSTLTAEHPGLVGKLLARGPAHVLRLSALYALFAREREIGVAHVESALAAWDYSKDSVEAIFQDRTGNTVADRIRKEMLLGQQLSINELRRDLFSNHVLAGPLADAIELLRELREIEVEDRDTAGRPVRIVRRVDPKRRTSAAMVDTSVSPGAESVQSAESLQTSSAVTEENASQHLISTESAEQHETVEIEHPHEILIQRFGGRRDVSCSDEYPPLRQSGDDPGGLEDRRRHLELAGKLHAVIGRRTTPIEEGEAGAFLKAAGEISFEDARNIIDEFAGSLWDLDCLRDDEGNLIEVLKPLRKVVM